jgi:hypothetical protein
LSSTKIRKAAFSSLLSSKNALFVRAVRDSLVAAGAIYVLLVVGIGVHEGPLRFAHFFADDMRDNANLQRMLLLGFVLDNSAWIAPITFITSLLVRTGSAVVRASLDAGRAEGIETSRTPFSDFPKRQDEGGRPNG